MWACFVTIVAFLTCDSLRRQMCAFDNQSQPSKMVAIEKLAVDRIAEYEPINVLTQLEVEPLGQVRVDSSTFSSGGVWSVGYGTAVRAEARIRILV